MKIRTFTVGWLSTNCYVMHSQHTRDAIVVDPGFDNLLEADQIIRYLDSEALKVKFVINTHGHSDHVSGNRTLQEKCHVPVCIHAADAQLLRNETGSVSGPDVLLKDGESIGFGDSKLTVVHTPGHTKGSICLLATNLIFTGDTLFAGSIGRTDFPDSSYTDMLLSLEKLKQLSDGLVVYPGHGPSSLLCEEKRTNPFLV